MIDDRLREIVTAMWQRGMDELPIVVGDEVDQIKQAFADEGYLTPKERVAWHDEHFNNGHMSRQEFYDRFENELQKTYIGLNKARRIPNPDNVQKAMLEAARKAANL